MTVRLVASGAARNWRGTDVLTSVDLEVGGGEVMALIGPNGGGKSTLLLMFAGLVRPSAGTITLDGTPTHEIATSSSGSIGLITATPGLYPLLTGRENLEFFGGLYGLSVAEVADRAGEMVRDLGLGGVLDVKVAAYSSGMQQKLSLVRAQLLRPRVLLLDEPTANLDPVSTDTIHRVVRRLADGGMAVVLVTHDLHAAEWLCDRVAVLAGGLRAVERLEGERVPPPTGRLFELYRAWATP